MEAITLSDLILANLILAVGTALQCVIGYGLALLSAPLLFLISAAFLPAPVILCATLLTILLTLKERQALVMSELKWSAAGNVVGTALAGLTLAAINTAQFELIFGLTILLAVAISLLGFKPQINRGTCSGAGLIAGYMATCTSIGGPPMALLYQNASIDHVRANLAAYFLFGAATAITALYFSDNLGLTELTLFAACCPGILIGFALSHRLFRNLSLKTVKPIILTLATFSGLIAVYNGL